MDLIIQLVLGAIGGNFAGALLKNLSLGPLGNSVAGIIGGGIGGQLLNAATGGTSSGTPGGIIADIAAGGVGGIVVLVIVGFLRGALARK